LYARAPVRALLVAAGGRGLPFLEDLLTTFAEPVFTETNDAAVPSLLTANHAELVVIARDAWREEDTELCGRLYGARMGVPILAVSGPCALEERAGALRAGADEFLSMPFEAEELVVRAFALVRRASSGPRHSRVGAFLVDFGRRQVFAEGKSIPLTLREYDVLSTLIERAGEVVTRQELAERTSSTAARDSNIVDVHVSRIREKLGARASSIETVRGIGYRFRES
jgi:DNA-binding response OmpR family regulator